MKNQTIIQIANEAKDYARKKVSPDMSSRLYSAEAYNNKFAELIVLECITIMKKHDYHGEWLGDKLKDHFGIQYDKSETS